MKFATRVQYFEKHDAPTGAIRKLMFNQIDDVLLEIKLLLLNATRKASLLPIDTERSELMGEEVSVNSINLDRLL
jgi:hypothetical protein